MQPFQEELLERVDGTEIEVLGLVRFEGVSAIDAIDHASEECCLASWHSDRWKVLLALDRLVTRGFGVEVLRSIKRSRASP